MKEKFEAFDIVVYAFMLLVLVVILYPILNMIAISFSESSHILKREVGIIPKGFNLKAYAMVLKTNSIMRSFGNTILYTAVGTFVNVLMTCVMAYPLSKGDLVFRNVIIKLVLFSMFFTGGVIPTYLVVKATGLIDTMWALAIPNAIWTVNLLIMVSFYRGLPSSLFESAKLDGASEYTILLRIVLPLSKAALASVGLFYFMGHWNSFFLPLIYLNSSAKFPVQIILKNMLIEESLRTSTSVLVSSNVTTASMKNAAILVTMIPVVIIYPFAQRYFVKGVMIGSIKG